MLRSTTENETRVLSKGLNYATDYTNKDVLQFIAQIEPVIEDIRDITTDERGQLRQQIISSINSAKKTNNLSYDERQAINRLKNDDTIVIAKADKGNVTVVLDKVDYDSKIEEHLNDEATYKKLNRNTTQSLKNKINSTLKKLKDKDSFDRETYQTLYCSTAVTPTFSGLIKIHKVGEPIRPIVSFVESPTYRTAQLLSNVLTPFTSLAPQKLKNSSDAKQFLENIVISDDQLLVSFDVKSLFTSVPTDIAHQQVREVLMYNQDLLHQHTSLSIEEILELLTLCLNAAVFQWQDQIYQQVHGTPMGSPISVVLAELFMQKLEEEIFLNAPYQPIFWKRYLDDIITVLPRDLIHVFLDYINSVNEHITYTVETETNNFLPYILISILSVKKMDILCLMSTVSLPITTTI